MDPSKFPFDIETYKRQSEIDERYIALRFREYRNKIEEDYPTYRSRVRPMGRDGATKKSKKKGRGIALEVVNEEWNKFKQFKEQELEQLDKITMKQKEANQQLNERTQAKKIKMFMKLSEKEHLDDQSKKLLEKLGHDLFGD
ncbi:uncharacterized protein LOC112085230 [Eutrema salsugineum]|uniref:uncharacterized protein LOC112085230 n=1 Tax=Eutrema salsugineum TaxID=72664 RepID=UPI000CED17BC|nr:uncharacterized protein LOC112085230 [Eutrema salsugineum]